MSPIEAKLLEALRALASDAMFLLDETSDKEYPNERTVVLLSREVHVESYRLDFLLKARGVSLAVECDGHDFHDRTKQQAAYDRSRDRELLKLGIITIRFTGSEIHHSPERCAECVFEVLEALIDARDELELDTFDAGFAAGQMPRDKVRVTQKDIL